MKKFRLTNQEIENSKCHLNEEIGNPQMKKSKNTIKNLTIPQVKKLKNVNGEFVRYRKWMV